MSRIRFSAARTDAAGTREVYCAGSIRSRSAKARSWLTGIGAILSMARRTGRLWRCSAGEGAPGRRPDCSAISETRVCVPKARLEAGDRASSARAIKNRNAESRKARLLNRLFRRDSRWRRVRLWNLAIRAPCAHIHRGSGLLSSELWNLERHGASCVRTRRCRRNRAKALRVDILRIGSYFRIGNRDVRPLSRFSPGTVNRHSGHRPLCGLPMSGLRAADGAISIPCSADRSWSIRPSSSLRFRRRRRNRCPRRRSLKEPCTKRSRQRCRRLAGDRSPSAC